MPDMPEKPKEVKPWDLLNPAQPRSTKEIQQERLAICQGGCEFYNSLAGTCRVCKCVMFMKTKLTNARCPVGKW